VLASHETQATLDAIVDSVPAARLLLLVNHRPEYKHDWGSRTYYRQFRTDPLPSAIAADLLDSLLGPDPELTPLLSLVEFPSVEQAKLWYDSEEYRPFEAMRLRAATTNVVLLEGQ